MIKMWQRLKDWYSDHEKNTLLMRIYYLENLLSYYRKKYGPVDEKEYFHHE